MVGGGRASNAAAGRRSCGGQAAVGLGEQQVAAVGSGSGSHACISLSVSVPSEPTFVVILSHSEHVMTARLRGQMHRRCCRCVC